MATGDRRPIGAASKLHVEVEHVGWHGPPQCKVAPQLRARVVGDEEIARADRIRRCGEREELVFPHPPLTSGDQLAGHEANGHRRLARVSREFKIHGPHRGEGHQRLPCNRSRTGWSGISITRSLNASPSISGKLRLGHSGSGMSAVASYST